MTGRDKMIVMCYVDAYRRGLTPSVREVQAAARYATPSAADYRIERLCDAGWLRRDGRRHASRGVTLGPRFGGVSQRPSGRWLIHEVLARYEPHGEVRK